MRATPISAHMTPLPFTIGEDIPLAEARKKMRDYHIRHLPVQYAGKVVGVLSDRDVNFALSLRSAPNDLKIGDVMSEGAYSVRPETPLIDVLREMERKKYGCAVVVNPDGRALGVFTTIDAIHTLATFLETTVGVDPAKRTA